MIAHIHYITKNLPGKQIFRTKYLDSREIKTTRNVFRRCFEHLNSLGMRIVRLLLELLLQEGVRLSLLGPHSTGLKGVLSFS